MAQQSRPHIILASLTLAGGSRYPSALGHLVRTAAVAAYLANVLELDDAEQRHIYLVAPVHDIGKLGIPDDVLLKPAALTDAEHEIMQRHSNIGADLLAGTADPILQLAASVARHHHEHFDGSGYPAGLAGKTSRLPRASWPLPMRLTPCWSRAFTAKGCRRMTRSVRWQTRVAGTLTPRWWNAS